MTTALAALVALFIVSGVLLAQSCRYYRRAKRICQQASSMYQRAQAAQTAARRTEQQATATLRQIDDAHHQVKHAFDANAQQRSRLLKFSHN
jgi:hypothetical protein